MTQDSRLQAWRIVLVLTGVLLLLVGAVTLVNDVPPERYPAIGVWLVGALVIHDGVAAMIVFGVAVLLRRTGGRIPFVVIAIAEAALAVAVIVTVVIGPEIVKKADRYGQSQHPAARLPGQPRMVLWRARRGHSHHGRHRPAACAKEEAPGVVASSRLITSTARVPTGPPPAVPRRPRRRAPSRERPRVAACWTSSRGSPRSPGGAAP